MKTKMTLAMVAAIGALALAANAQDNTPPSDSQPPSQHAGAPGGVAVDFMCCRRR